MMLNSYTYQPVSSDKRFKAVLVEIKLAQRACDMHNNQHLVPKIFKGMSLVDIQNHQRHLCTEMRSLEKSFTDEQFNKIVDKAETEAEKLIHLTTDGPFAFK